MMKTLATHNDETRPKVRSAWFDSECQLARKAVKTYLRRFHTDNKRESRIAYVDARRDYKKLIRKKRTAYSTTRSKYILESVNNPTLFWKEIRSVTFKTFTRGTVTPAQWFNHFKTL